MCTPDELDAVDIEIAQRDSSCAGPDAGVPPDGSVSPGSETCNEGDPCETGFRCVFGVCANTAHCWGQNYGRQLGADPDEKRNTVDDATMLSSSTNHNCIVRLDGSLLCRGANSAGQSGQESGIDVLVGEVPGFGPSHPVLQLATGVRHTCVRVEGDAYCFGDHTGGRLLSDDVDEPTHIPSKVTEDGNVLGVWAGYERTCVWIEETGPRCNQWP